MHRAVIMSAGAFVSAANLRTEALGGAERVPTLREVRRKAERAAVERALAATLGNLARLRALPSFWGSPAQPSTTRLTG